MKKLSEKRKFTAPNAWGRDDTSLRQAFQVEESDVGRAMDNYGGHRRPAYTFTQADVGQVIEITTYPSDINYSCWGFGSVFPTNHS